MAKSKKRLSGIVKLKELKNGKPVYGDIFAYDSKSDSYKVMIFDNADPNVDVQFRIIPEQDLIPMPAKTITENDVRRFIRAEIFTDDLTKGADPEFNLEYVGGHIDVTLNDMEAAVKNLAAKKFTAKELMQKWAIEFNDMFEDSVAYSISMWIDNNDYNFVDGLFYVLVNDFVYQYDDSYAERTDMMHYDRILEDIENYRKNQDIFFDDWSYFNELSAVERLSKDDFIKSIPEDKLPWYRKTLERLAKENQPAALEALGYCCYGGCRIYECDWEKSRDCFLKLIEDENTPDQKKGQYANTLGYIYYYGRCNGGTPEYEKAFKCFKTGALYGYFESVYKLSDMFYHGYGTPVNVNIARRLVEFFYKDNLTRFLEGDCECNFADLALRYGNFLRDDNELHDAAAHYLMAQHSLKKRLPFAHYGDENVMMSIQRELAKLDDVYPVDKSKSLVSPQPFVTNLAMDSAICKVTFAKAKNGVKITAERLPAPGKNVVRRFFIISVGHRFCEAVEKASEIAEGVSLVWTADKGGEFHADYLANENGVWTFRLFGKRVAYIQAQQFVFKMRAPAKRLTEKHVIAKVTFSDGGKTYDYLADGFDIKEGDKAVVQTNQIEAVVTVVKVMEMALKDMPLEPKCYKSILRKL